MKRHKRTRTSWRSWSRRPISERSWVGLTDATHRANGRLRQAVTPTNPDVTALIHIAQMAEAIATMARQQASFEQHVDTRFTALQGEIVEQREEVMGRLDQAAAVVGSLLHRMNAVEGMVARGRASATPRPPKSARSSKRSRPRWPTAIRGQGGKAATRTRPFSGSCTAGSAYQVTITSHSGASARS